MAGKGVFDSTDFVRANFYSDHFEIISDTAIRTASEEKMNPLFDQLWTVRSAHFVSCISLSHPLIISLVH